MTNIQKAWYHLGTSFKGYQDFDKLNKKYDLYLPTGVEPTGKYTKEIFVKLCNETHEDTSVAKTFFTEANDEISEQEAQYYFFWGKDSKNTTFETEKTEVFRSRITPKMKTQAEELAAKKGLNLSEYVRYLLQREIDKNHKS